MPERSWPAYLDLYKTGELQRRAEEAVASLASCQVCPRNCKVNRLEDMAKVCATGRNARVSTHFPHFGEEDCLRGDSGSGTIFFAFCNLKCVFCFAPETLVTAGSGGGPRVRRIGELFEACDSFEEKGPGRVGRPGDLSVLTRAGHAASVPRVFSHPYSGELLCLKPAVAPPMRVTPNHTFFAVHDSNPGSVLKLRADQLTTRHLLVAPVRVTGDAELRAVVDGRAYPWRFVGDRRLIPLTRIEREAYEGLVYNLEVDDPDHSYLAPFAAVGNCQNHDTSQAGEGREVTPVELAAMMMELQEIGCHNINFVTPEHVVPQVLEALVPAVEMGLRLPIVYNTSAYDSMESMRWLDGVVDIYMPDFKLWEKKTSIRYLKAKDYRPVACEILEEMHRQVGPLQIDEETGLARRGVLVRHLVMPGLLEETGRIFEFLHEVSPETYVNVMGQYRPEYKADQYEEINRRPTAEEMEEARRLFFASGLKRIDRRSPLRRKKLPLFFFLQ